MCCLCSCGEGFRPMFNSAFSFVSTQFASLESKYRFPAHIGLFICFPVMKRVSWDRISFPPCHTVQCLVKAGLEGVFSMLISCCLKGELAVINNLGLVLFSASRIVLSSDTCIPLYRGMVSQKQCPWTCVMSALFAFKG